MPKSVVIEQDAEIIRRLIDRYLTVGGLDATGRSDSDRLDEGVLFEARHVWRCRDRGVDFYFSPLLCDISRYHVVLVHPFSYISELRLVFLK